MKFSIITINYNNCKGLKRTLDSIISQTCREFEWIVIDGGSRDGSRELIEQHHDTMTYWCSEPDKGIYNAMNKGVKKANGDYCLFLNSGDNLCNSKVIEHLISMPFSADIVSGDIYIDGYSHKYLRKSVNNINALWLYDNSLCHPATWIRRELLLKNPYHENYKTISDWVFFFETLVIKSCSYQHIPYAFSVFYKDGISNSPNFNARAYADKYAYLKTVFPAKYVDDKAKDESYYFISSNVLRMTKLGKFLMKVLFRLVMFVELRFLKPLSHFTVVS